MESNIEYNKYESGMELSPTAEHTCQMCHPIAPEHCRKFTATLLALNLNINPILVTKIHEYMSDVSVFNKTYISLWKNIVFIFIDCDTNK